MDRLDRLSDGVEYRSPPIELMCIPAIVLVYYYKKFEHPTMKGTLIALLISFAIVGLMMYGVVQGLVEICGWFELFL
jgi:hypothetical protein